MMARTLPILLVLALAGCALAPDYRRPEMELPEGWRAAPDAGLEQGMQAPESWWQCYGSPELDRLVDMALRHNNDLRAALQRMEQARADTRIAGAGLWPALSGGGEASRDDNGVQAPVYGYRAQVGVAYEVDIWRRNRTLRDAAESRLAASAFDRDALALLLASDVARLYFQSVNLRQRQSIAGDNLANARGVLVIAEARFHEGASSALEVAQQRTALANAEAALASLAQQEVVTENALAVLLGRPPQAMTITAEDLHAVAVPEIAPSQPSALLERRPDIRRAEAELVAAHADIGVARANFFPQLQLGADAALAAAHPGAAATALAASVLTPVFQGGRLQGELERTWARQAELVETYRKAVLTSFREVEDALASVAAAERRLSALRTAVDEARRAYRISRERYQAGAADFLTVLDTQRSQLLAEDNLAQAQLERLVASVDLVKALGGGWKEQPVP
ncbi:MAG TPA: efflux transporter outer membrane subunit [Methylococcaceae bacterium]|nr:efflux transporter outer membrane subunit [Methylococcaceae bacterium]